MRRREAPLPPPLIGAEMSKIINETRHLKRRPDGKPVGTCDRCGFAYPYQRLRFDWQGLFVCHGADTVGCWEPMHPRLMFTAPVDNSLSMANPRPPRDANGLEYVDGPMTDKAPLSYHQSLEMIRRRGSN
jgi:hypothetical protein